MVDNELYLPYWQRKEFKSYKHIKVIKPELHSTVKEYTANQINKSEKNLVNDALVLKQKLKNIDNYPVNAIDANMEQKGPNSKPITNGPLMGSPKIRKPRPQTAGRPITRFTKMDNVESSQSSV
jgi:hypothetical protein